MITNMDLRDNTKCLNERSNVSMKKKIKKDKIIHQQILYFY